MPNKFIDLEPMLAAQVRSGQLAHAYIFSGQDSLEQAISLAAKLNCGEDNGPCGSCPVCLNIAAGSYPDCHLIEPDRGSHRLEGMKALALQAQLSAANGGWKVFILSQADKISDEAANNLLKLLEEPPPGTIFILLSDQPEQLLPTIRSRCQLFVLDNGFVRQDSSADVKMIKEAKQLLMAMPKMHIYEVLLKSREREKREDQRAYLLSLLIVLHQAATGNLTLPMDYSALIRSETIVESSLELIDNNINQKMLMDVVYLRLWQNCQH